MNEIIETLQNAGMAVEKVSEDAYNVMSTATGAILERLVPFSELESYVRCITYTKQKHWNDITNRFTYTKPVHGS